MGLTHDPENEDLKDGERRALDGFNKCLLGDEMEEKLARARADPELVAIMTDPVIQQLLCGCSSSPGAAAAHFKNAGVAAAKVQMLVDAGLMSPEK